MMQAGVVLVHARAELSAPVSGRQGTEIRVMDWGRFGWDRLDIKRNSFPC